MDTKVKMAVTFLVVAAVACVVFCTFVFLCKFTIWRTEQQYCRVAQFHLSGYLASQPLL